MSFIARCGRPVAALSVVVGCAVVLSSASDVPFTVHQKAYYLDEKTVDFVRPGLVIKITGVNIATDGTIRARFRLSDPRGLPLDRLGITTPGAVSVSLVAATIPKGQTQYTAYTTRVVTSPITNATAVQAGAGANGVFEQTSEGEHQYTFNTKAPATLDRTATHSVGV